MRASVEAAGPEAVAKLPGSSWAPPKKKNQKWRTVLCPDGNFITPKGPATSLRMRHTPKRMLGTYNTELGSSALGI